MMKRIPVILNGIAALLSAGLFLYTFVAEKHLQGLARGFVTAKTLEYSKPLFDLTERSLDSTLAKKLMPKSVGEAIEEQIATYKENPFGYVSDLTNPTRTGQKRRSIVSPGSRVDALKAKVRDYYDETMAALIRDLRIFSGSNLTASILALILALRSPKGLRKYALWFSFLLFAAVLFSSYLYIDGMGFFSILFKWHLGWWYPIGLFLTTTQLFIDYGRKPFGKDSEMKAATTGKSP